MCPKVCICHYHDIFQTLKLISTGDRDADIYLPLALLPKNPEDDGWMAMETTGEVKSDKQRGRRKVKEQLKALKEPQQATES